METLTKIKMPSKCTARFCCTPNVYSEAVCYFKRVSLFWDFTVAWCVAKTEAVIVYQWRQSCAKKNIHYNWKKCFEYFVCPCHSLKPYCVWVDVHYQSYSAAYFLLQKHVLFSTTSSLSQSRLCPRIKQLLCVVSIRRRDTQVQADSLRQ